MAQIVDPVAIAFVNDRVRPICEAVRAINALIEDAEVAWFNGANNLFPSADTIERSGLPTLTGTDVTNIVTALMAIRDATTETAGRAGLIVKATVRPLEAS